jgi:hydrogenase-4 component B
MNATDFYYLTLLLFFLGIVLPIVMPIGDNRINFIAHGMAAGGSFSAVLCAIFIFIEGSTVLPLFTWQHLGLVEVKFDYLGAYFLLMAGILGTVTSIYAIGYCKEFYGRRLRLLALCFNGFLLSMVIVFTINHVVAFLISWEMMTILSFFLVNHEWEQTANRRAAYIYLVMTHIGTAFIIAAFLLLATSAGSFSFSHWGHIPLSEAVRNSIFLLGLIGFGTKAGIIPVHVWLPQAHPIAPSHVSALMSGVMIKSAVYGLSRLLLEFLAPVSLWWGLVVLVLAILTCLLAVLYALMENNLKKVLAYSSVENMGIIFLSIGAGLVFAAKGQALLAGLAWTAALFHAFNHGLFKALLFLGAGAVVQATHLKDMEEMGGLIKTMPYTALLFLIGSAAIAALPLSNGFVSEWLTFQSLFYLPQGIEGIGGKLGGAVLVALLGLTGALAAACFVKVFGITFLAKPRSHRAQAATEREWTMLVPMGVLAGLCITLGLWPNLVLKPLKMMLATYPELSTAGLIDNQWVGLVVTAGYDETILAISVAAGALLLGITLALVLVTHRSLPERSGETWTCGIYPTARMEYTGTGFSKPLRIAFASILRPHRQIIVDVQGNDYYGSKLEYRITIQHVFTEKIYKPFNERIIRGAKVFRKLQNGSLRLYIGYILTVTIVALIWSSR